MAETPRELVVLITHGMDDERSSVAFTIANGGMTAGLQVSIFLTSAAVDLVRKRAIEHTSELQSQSNLVCRLLLEKKKKIGQPPVAGKESLLAQVKSTIDGDS